MQITNSVVFGRRKGCIYKQIKPPLVGEHAFPLTGFVCKEAHVTLLCFVLCFVPCVLLLIKEFTLCILSFS